MKRPSHGANHEPEHLQAVSLHIILATLCPDRPSSAAIASIIPEIAYRNSVARVGIDPATFDLVVIADVFLADMIPTRAFLARQLKALQFFASCAAEVVRSHAADDAENGIAS